MDGQERGRPSIRSSARLAALDDDERMSGVGRWRELRLAQASGRRGGRPRTAHPPTPSSDGVTRGLSARRSPSRQMEQRQATSSLRPQRRRRVVLRRPVHCEHRPNSRSRGRSTADTSRRELQPSAARATSAKSTAGSNARHVTSAARRLPTLALLSCWRSVCVDEVP